MPLRCDSAGISKAFGRAVRARREQLGLSQEEFGFQADLDRTYVSGVERGTRNPTLRIIAQIAKALGARPSALLRTAERLQGGR